MRANCDPAIRRWRNRRTTRGPTFNGGNGTSLLYDVVQVCRYDDDAVVSVAKIFYGVHF